MGKKNQAPKEEPPAEKPKVNVVVKSPYLPANENKSEASETGTPPQLTEALQTSSSGPQPEALFKSAVVALGATAVLTGVSVQMAPPPAMSQVQQTRKEQKPDFMFPLSKTSPTTVTITYPPGEGSAEISPSTWHNPAVSDEHQPKWDSAERTLKFLVVGAAYLKALEPVILEYIKKDKPGPEKRGVSIGVGGKTVTVENVKDLKRAVDAAKDLEEEENVRKKRAAHK